MSGFEQFSHDIAGVGLIVDDQCLYAGQVDGHGGVGAMQFRCGMVPAGFIGREHL